MDTNIAKLYAAYRSGCLGDNIFYAYFPFLANIIYEEKWETVDEAQVAEMFRRKYDMFLPLNFVRQILGVGLERDAIIYEHGKYVAQLEKLKSYTLSNSDFDSCWTRMMDGFKKYCAKNGFEFSEKDINANVLNYFDVYDEAILSDDELYAPEKSDTFNYIWHSYLKTLSENNPVLFDFVVALSFGNIMKEAIFYTGDKTKSASTFKGLNVYLDTPMVFALLGMDSTARIDSCKMLISEMEDSGCNVQIFDHNLQEIKGIMERAAGWATSNDYDIRKANNVARYFHDVLMDAPTIAEFCAFTEEKLNGLGITIKTTAYDVCQNEFQEDEQSLYSMIEERYTQDGRIITEEKERSIMIDIRSIIMVYRERRGQVSTQIQTSNHIMVTLNGTIANISKNFESNRSISSGHIPACVSADIFGAILWLFTPSMNMEYQRRQLLADCYIAMRPSREMLDKYVESLIRARNADEIDEKKFLFMRAHVAVNDALMNVTKGDYARFNDQTYREVYDEIISTADKKYADEASAHYKTKEQLSALQDKYSTLNNKVDDLEAELHARDETNFNNKCKIWGWIFAIFVFGIPYTIIITIIEITKGLYSNISISAILHVGLLVVATIVLGSVFLKGKEWCFRKIREYFSQDTKSVTLESAVTKHDDTSLRHRRDLERRRAS